MVWLLGGPLPGEAGDGSAMLGDQAEREIREDCNE